MRIYEIESPKQYRSPKVTLRHLHASKLKRQAHENSLAKRRAFLPAMYGRDDPVEEELKQIELEKQRMEIRKLEAELEAEEAMQGSETYKAIKRLSRSTMARRKKA